MEMVLMLIWTIVSNPGTAVTQTSTLVPRTVCEETRKMPDSEIKRQPTREAKVGSGSTAQYVFVTVKCIPVPK